MIRRRRFISRRGRGTPHAQFLGQYRVAGVGMSVERFPCSVFLGEGVAAHFEIMTIARGGGGGSEGACCLEGEGG